LNIGRSLLYSDELDEIKHLRETLYNSNVDPADFIRKIPLAAIVKDFESNKVRSEIPGLRSVFPQLKETVAITTALAQLKIADTVLEGAEPYGYWKDVWRVEMMDTPKLSVPKSTSSDLVPSLEDIKGTDGTPAKIEGGQFTSIDFDCSDDKGYYRVAAQIKRNWLKDNNFRAIETHLKQLGEAWYYRLGGFLFTAHAAGVTVSTDTKANLDGVSNTFLEALINMVEAKIPANRFTPDTIIMHPNDAYATKVEQWGTAGPIPLVSNQYFDRNATNVNNSGFAAVTGVKNVWITPWATENTVLCFQKEKGFIIGLRQDLEFEDFDDNLMGLQGAVTSMRIDKQIGYETSNYKATSF